MWARSSEENIDAKTRHTAKRDKAHKKHDKIKSVRAQGKKECLARVLHSRGLVRLLYNIEHPAATLARRKRMCAAADKELQEAQLAMGMQHGHRDCLSLLQDNVQSSLRASGAGPLDSNFPTRIVAPPNSPIVTPNRSEEDDTWSVIPQCHYDVDFDGCQ